MDQPAAPSLLTNFVHLGPGARVVPQPAFDGGGWYDGYGTRHDADGVEGRLVSLFHFTAPWDSWEMHPEGDELVLCLTGALTLIQEHPGGATTTLTIGPNEYSINGPGVWHTADVTQPTTALFITAGLGTQARPR